VKLSEAIRLGAMMKPQGFDGTGNRECPRTCAFGAALDAVSGENVAEIWPWLRTLFDPCPVCADVSRPSYYESFGVIPHLNNDHRWTREQIADWVAEIEARSTPVEAQPDAVSACCSPASAAQSVR
jgi:hypothetical protein